MLDNGIIPCTDTKKKTHRYLIKKSDVIDFIEKGTTFDYPIGLFTSGDNQLKKTNYFCKIDSDEARKWYEKEFEKEKDILQLKDVIRLTGFSDEAVRKWMQAGDLIGIQNGPYKVIPKLYLIKWMSSAKYLSKALTDLGYPKSKKSVLPYIGLMMDMGIVEPSDNSLKPYTIVKSKDELQEIMNNFFCENLADYTTNLAYDQDLHGYSVNRRYAADGI